MRLVDQLFDVRLVQVMPRQVDREEEVVAARRERGQGGFDEPQHLRRQGVDQARLLGGGNEEIGPDDLPVRSPPADQRFRTHPRPVLQADDRLEHEEEFAVAQS